MKRSAPKTKIEGSSLQGGTILILDKQGVIGNGLLEKLAKESLPGDVIFLPYHRKIPQISRYSYSKMFIIYNGEEELLEVFPQFIEEAKISKATIIFVLPITTASENLVKDLASSYKNIKVVLLGDLFGGDILQNQSLLNKFLYQAKKTGQVKLEGEGLGEYYPVSFNDAISKIFEVGFLGETRHLAGRPASRVFNLFPKHPLTELSVAGILQKADPLLKISFVEGENKKKEPKRGEVEGDEFLLKDDYPLEEKIKQTFESLQVEKSLDVLKKESSFRKLAFSALLFLCLVLILPFFATLLFSFLGAAELKMAKNTLEKGNFSAAKSQATISNLFFTWASNAQNVLVFEASLIGKRDSLAGFTETINTGREISLAFVGLIRSFENILQVTSGKSKNPKEDVTASLNSFKTALVVFQKIRTEKSLNFSPALIQFVSNTIDISPNLLGLEGEKRYLILFQNNMELRPGGGFIGSYGLLTLKEGKVLDFSIHDVYDADGQLKGHVEPPFAIRRYVPLVHWYLRDSNFSPDFPKNASQAAFFLNQEMGKLVDGVIGIDISFIKSLLEVLGPLRVSDFNETVTSDNFYLLAQRHAEKNFFPGSSQKKDFLRSVFRALEQSFSTKRNLPYLRLAETIATAVSQKHLLLSLGDSNLQTVFTVNRMSSSLWDKRENKESTVNDFLGISEANLGVNKANFFVKRKISQEVRIDENGNIFERLTVYYKNKSTAWPGGDYKNYLRVVLPLGSKMTSVSIDDKEQEITPAITDFQVYEAKNFSPPNGLEIEEKEEEGKSIFGFLVFVPSGALKKIAISYTLSQKISPDVSFFSYDQRIFKQPGTEDDPYSFSLSYPQNLKVFSLSSEFKDSQNKISFSANLSKDIDFEIGLSKK